jgi:hypothetical protein
MPKVDIKPSVKNRYKLTVSSIKKLQVGDRSKICEPLFWYNNAVNAWCISGSVGKFEDAEFWIGIYDDDAPAYKGKFRFNFSTYMGMCNYTFEKFYDKTEIENNYDWQIQEKFLGVINHLLDEGILVKPKGQKRK